MRRSSAPSQMIGGEPLRKRPRFHPPFVNASGNSSACNSSSVGGKIVQEECDSKLHRALQGIRKTSEEVDFKSGKPAPELQTCVSNMLNSSVTGKENCAPELTPLPELASNSVYLTDCTNDNELQSPQWVEPGHHQKEEVKVNPNLGGRRGGFKAPFKLSSSHQLLTTSSCDQEQGSTQVESRRPENACSSGCKYYSVMWCKYSKKKHKKWEGDAILVVKGGSVSLKDMDGKDIGKGSGYKQSELSGLIDGSALVVGGKELEIMSEISEHAWKSGKCFTGTCTTEGSAAIVATCIPKAMKKFVNPSLSGPITVHKKSAGLVVPLHNPHLPNALVMPRPNSRHQMLYNQKGLQLVDVVVDPHLSVHLRPHQREGVVFLYECVSGMREYSGQGAILADEMGLGKTFQCIATLWTIYKQGPYGGKPLVRKALIVTPGSLVKNWEKEFRKWLGNERLKVFCVSSDKRAKEFVSSVTHPVLIISYEMFLKSHESLSSVNFDVVICDEGHRLKNSGAKTTSLIMGLSSRRRIVLTGTPIQNDLQEFYSLIEFCNPGILGSHSAFKKVYEEPIVLSRQPAATSEEKVIGDKRANELKRLTSLFCLRRTQEINKKYLPPKVENVVFCKMSPLQLILYKHLLNSQLVKSCVKRSSNFSPHLSCIGALKKICNSPRFIYEAAQISAIVTDRIETNEQIDEGLYRGMSSCFPLAYNPQSVNIEDSGKLLVLSELLHYLLATSMEKVVLVSNYTQALDMLQKLCEVRGYGYLRLDGSTPAGKRLSLVDRFNRKFSTESIFLLSSKAGGVGLNLTGASRLILYDIDWNPANDLQAMARVWRDGQQRKVHIYRLITTGTIEEKIFQRQISKQGLNSVVDFDNNQINENGSVKFSTEELKDLFTLCDNTSCETHDLLSCRCGENRLQEDYPELSLSGTSTNTLRATSTSVKLIKNASMDELFQWRHFNEPVDQTPLCDQALLEASDHISFVFQNETVISTE